MSDVITNIVPSAPRRAFGAGVLYLLGGLLISVGVTEPPSAMSAAFLITFGAFCLYSGWRMWKVTGRVIELTSEELRLSDGTLICKIDDIHKVDRSFFAFKPSNGFLVTLKTKYPTAWIPGLWWRSGKRIGVGGVTPGASGKFMADTLTAMLAQRDGTLKDLDL
ncbi:MAG: hypothetical protein OXC60_02665 [Litoreibacter sp.]|nr:hypothetical protein [Litoreibacter sp.]